METGTFVEGFETETSGSGLKAEITVMRIPAGAMWPNPAPKAADLPPDVAEALIRWVLEREDMFDRRERLDDAGMLP